MNPCSTQPVRPSQTSHLAMCSQSNCKPYPPGMVILSLYVGIQVLLILPASETQLSLSSSALSSAFTLIVSVSLSQVSSLSLCLDLPNITGDSDHLMMSSLFGG